MFLHVYLSSFRVLAKRIVKRKWGGRYIYNIKCVHSKLLSQKRMMDQRYRFGTEMHNKQNLYGDNI